MVSNGISIAAALVNTTNQSSSPSILKATKISNHLQEQQQQQQHILTDEHFNEYSIFTTSTGNTTIGSTFVQNNNNNDGQPPAKRRKQDPKNGKGLRHFSMKVCEKVKMKGTTSYNEVADELVSEFSADPIAERSFQQGGYMVGDAEPYDQKNIRRRVYDALNVLMAMNIISKEKKEIKWIGLPTNAAQECAELERERRERRERIEQKRQHLRDLMIQQIAIKNLVERNKSINQTTPPNSNAIIFLPFIIVNTNRRTVIDCSISNDKSEYLFTFDNTFEIHDDIEVLKRMDLAFGLGKNSFLNIDKNKYERARAFLPEALRGELDKMVDEDNAKAIK